MAGGSNTTRQELSIESNIPTPTTASSPALSDISMRLNPECAKQKPETQDQPGFDDHSKDACSDSPCNEARKDVDEEFVITSIRATDVIFPLRRLPTGFYCVVQHSDREWRSAHKTVSVSDTYVEWDDPIPIPSDMSATVSVMVYASFEFQPRLGNGEMLRKLAVTVKELLDHSADEDKFMFCPDDGDVISPCSSILVTIKHRRLESGHSFESLDPFGLPTGEQDQLKDATDRGHAALSRYRKCGERQDLAHAVEQFERALDSCPSDSPWLAAVKSNLATAKLIYYQVDATGPSIDVPLDLYRGALAARPLGYPDRPSTLIQLAIVHLVRFERQQEELDATQAENLLHEAISLDTTMTHVKQAAIFLLEMRARWNGGPAERSNRLSVVQQSTLGFGDDLWTHGANSFARFRCFGQLADLHQAISALELAIRSSPVLDQQHAAGISSLSVALLCRFMHLHEQSDLEGAISWSKNVVDLISDDHLGKPGCLNNLATSLCARFQLLGQLGDLDDAISRYTHAFDIICDGHPLKHDLLSSLGASFQTRFKRTGDHDDLEQAISRYKDAVGLTRDGHPLKPYHLNTLGNLLRVRFARLGNPLDIEQAISMQKDSVDFIQDSHPNKPAFAFDLRNSIKARSDLLGDLSDLERVISMDIKAVQVTSDGHPHKASHLVDLGSSFFTRFERLGDIQDLEQSISHFRTAVTLTPDCDPQKADRLCSLSNSLRLRFEKLNDLSDLEQVISGYRDAIDLMPDGHSDKPCRLNALGNFLRIRFKQLGDPSDLEQAISLQAHSVDVTPLGHCHHFDHLFDLRNSLKIRFDCFGDLNDLERVISIDREAVDITPDEHPQKPSFLNALGNSNLSRFKQLGDMSNLEQAILRHRDAVNLSSDDDPDKPGYLSNLGLSLCTRFQHLGELSDLEHAISRQKNAVDITSNNDYELLTNLGNSLVDRFRHHRQLDDIEEAISILGHARDLIPDSHRNKSNYLNNLGNAFIARFTHFKKLSDLEEAISRYSDAVDSTADGRSAQPHHLCNLGTSLGMRFVQLGDPRDLEQAILRQMMAVDLTSEHHAGKPARMECLAESFMVRFRHTGKSDDCEQAIALYSMAACATAGSTIIRFRASRKWIAAARIVHHHTLLRAYSVAIDYLPQLAWIGLPLTDRYRELVHASDVVREAAAAALDLGRPQIAAEWLEQGRSVVWGDLLQLHASHDELSSTHPDQARRLQELSSMLEHASATHDASLTLLSAQEHSGWQSRYGYAEYAPNSFWEEADKHRALAINRDKLLQEIRRFPGFERFLLRKEFSELRASAHSGPVVILNATESRCDALLIRADGEDVLHVPLPSFTLKKSGGLQLILDNLLGPSRGIPCEDRAGKPAQRLDFSWESLLSTLWRGVVKPVLDALGYSTPGAMSRIFWCPTGPFTFLPIHAAGLYGAQHSEPGHKVFDFVISSYVPTLGILTRGTRDSTPSGNFRILAVPQPISDGQSRLPGVHVELEYIRATIKSSGMQSMLLEASTGSVDEVLELMKDADWVHFACHGAQDSEDPSNSGICLADERRLKLPDMISLSRERGGLAFLSACQTAMGDKNLSDEAVHIAAGMLFAGYSGVLGTMWSISDRIAPRLARDVYEQLFRPGATPDYREAARALHDAVARLRDSNASFVEWVPFIHVGL